MHRMKSPGRKKTPNPPLRTCPMRSPSRRSESPPGHRRRREDARFLLLAPICSPPVVGAPAVSAPASAGHDTGFQRIGGQPVDGSRADQEFGPHRRSPLGKPGNLVAKRRFNHRPSINKTSAPPSSVPGWILCTHKSLGTINSYTI